MRVPVCIVTGFLGAGKTTLVRRLLDGPHGAKTGVILNEIGEAGIDNLELSQAFVELKDRCACCVQGGDLDAAVDTVLAQDGIERIILETTGLADPLSIVWRLQGSERVSVQAVITVLDPTAPTTYGTHEWQQQAAAADAVVLSKQDLAQPEAALSALRVHNKHARVIAAELLADALLEGEIDLTARAPFLSLKHSEWTGTVISSDATHSLDSVEEWIEQLPDDVFRSKGIIKTDQGFIAFQRVAGRTVLDLQPPTPPHGQTRVAFFGLRIDIGALTESFRRT